MTKKEFMSHVAAIYACCNRADHEARHEHGEDWTKWQMAGEAGCAALDHMLAKMQDAGALTGDERQAFYDNQ